MSRRDLSTAVLSRLTSGVSVTVYDGKVPNSPTLPYAALYVGGGLAAVNNLGGVSGWTELEFQVTAVGLTGASARVAADACHVRVLDWSPTVAGFECGPVRQVGSQPIRRDDDVDPPVFYAIDIYRLAAVAAA